MINKSDDRDFVITRMITDRITSINQGLVSETKNNYRWLGWITNITQNMMEDKMAAGLLGAQRIMGEMAPSI